MLMLLRMIVGSGIGMLRFVRGWGMRVRRSWLRLLVRSGHAPVVSPAEFTDAITVITEKELKRAEKQAAKAARKSPLTEGQKKLALVGAYACFALCAAAVVAGILMLVVGH